MKFNTLLIGVGIAACTACARPSANEPATPTASPVQSGYATAPTEEAAPALAPPAPESPAAAPRAQGLDQARPADDGARDEYFPNLAAAERALNEAKADLDRLALAEPPVSAGHAAPKSGASADKAEKKDDKRAPSRSESGASASTSSSAVCDNACRAFASLLRAASAVCRLDGEHGSHCERAKRVLSTSQERVASCACQAE